VKRIFGFAARASDKNVRSAGGLKTGREPIYAETQELAGANRLMSKRLATHFKNKMPQGIIACQQ